MAKIPKKIDNPSVQHFSIFIENKVGALLDIVKILNENGVEVLGISILDSSDSSIVRVIVSDPDRVQQLLDNKIAYTMSQVLLIELPESSSDLAHILSSLLIAEINISFIYPLLIRPRGKSVLVLHPDDIECASSVLMAQRLKLLTQSDISR